VTISNLSAGYYPEAINYLFSMNKEELLRELSTRVNAGEISREEVVNCLELAPANTGETYKAESMLRGMHFSVTKMLYFLGASIVLLGIIFFVAQIWEDIGSFGRITVTLGLGLVIAALGSGLLKKDEGAKLGMVFHAIGGALIPGGAMVTLYELDTGIDSLWPIAITFGLIFAFYLVLTYVHKNAILTFFAIANGTAFIYFLVGAIVEDLSYVPDELFAYLTMVVGVSYLLLAHGFREGWNGKLVGVLYLLGTVGFLGAAFSQVFDSPFWQFLYILIVFGHFNTECFILEEVFRLAASKESNFFASPCFAL